MEITLDICKKVDDVVKVGLCMGKGSPIPGEMCVEAAVTYALGEDFSDEPSCVDPVLRSFKIALNDKYWSSNQARANGMRRIAIAQLGTKNTLDSKLFVEKLSKMTIKKIVPLALRFAASENDDHKVELEAAALRCEEEGTKESANNAYQVASKVYAAARTAAAYAAAYAAYAAAYAAATAAATAAAATAAAAYAAYAAAYAAAAYTAATDAARATAAADAKDKVLSDFAEEVVQILIEMGTPGSKFVGILVPYNG